MVREVWLWVSKRRRVVLLPLILWYRRYWGRLGVTCMLLQAHAGEHTQHMSACLCSCACHQNPLPPLLCLLQAWHSPSCCASAWLILWTMALLLPLPSANSFETETKHFHCHNTAAEHPPANRRCSPRQS